MDSEETFRKPSLGKSGRPYLDSSLFETPEPPDFAGTPPNEWSTIDMSYYDQNFVPRMAFRWFPTYNLNLGLQKHFTTAFGSRDVQWQFIVEVFNLLKNTFWDLPANSAEFWCIRTDLSDRAAREDCSSQSEFSSRLKEEADTQSPGPSWPRAFSFKGKYSVGSLLTKETESRFREGNNLISQLLSVKLTLRFKC